MEGVAWDLLLALVPVALGWLLGRTIDRMVCGDRLAWGACLLIAPLWLAFLPNACYLLTEWRHLLLDRQWTGLREAARHDHHAMLEIAELALFFLVFSGSGVLLFTLAIRPVERALRSAGAVPLVGMGLFFVAISLGVYLGLIERWNSWDLVSRPGAVLRSALEALASPKLLAVILGFGGFLWALYEAVDLWIDGIVDRARSWPRPAGAREETGALAGDTLVPPA